MLKSFDLWRSYANSIFITVVGTLINMLITTMAAYVLSKKDLKGQRFFMFLAVFTMMFTRRNYSDLHRCKGSASDEFAVGDDPAVGGQHLQPDYFKKLLLGASVELEEAALWTDVRRSAYCLGSCFRISKPALDDGDAVLCSRSLERLFSAIMYINKKEAWPLQLFLRSMLFQNDAAYSSGGESLFLLGQPMKMAAVMLAIIPIMCAYPFFQKYFTAGMTAGAVKG